MRKQRSGTEGSGNWVPVGIPRSNKRGGSALSWGTRSGEENRLNRARGIMLTESVVGEAIVIQLKGGQEKITTRGDNGCEGGRSARMAGATGAPGIGTGGCRTYSRLAMDYHYHYSYSWSRAPLSALCQPPLCSACHASFFIYISSLTLLEFSFNFLLPFRFCFLPTNQLELAIISNFSNN